MRPVTLMTHPHLLSLLLSLNKALKSYLPMALGIFAHNNGQRCSSLWVNLPIVVGKLYSCTSSLIIIVTFLACTLLFEYRCWCSYPLLDRFNQCRWNLCPRQPYSKDRRDGWFLKGWLWLVVTYYIPKGWQDIDAGYCTRQVSRFRELQNGLCTHL